jgi:chorismate mutase
MIPEQARLEIIKKKQQGETWTGISQWIEEEYGIPIHRTTVQRWYDREAFSEDEVDQEELLESIEDRTKLDKKVATYKAELNYYKKLYQQAILGDAKKDLIVEAIQTYAPTFDAVPIKPPPAKGKSSKPQVMVAVLTDTHVGEEVFAPQMMSMNAYDYDIFNRRLSGWANQVLNLATYRRNICNIDELMVPMLGDMISGDIHEELSRTNLDNCMMQMMHTASSISQALMFLAPHFKTIKVPCVVGNHGRMTRKPPMKDKYMDWDYLAYQWMAAFCANQKNIHFDIPKSFAHIVDIAGKNVLMFHGDAISGGGSSASISRMIGSMRGVIQFKQALESTIVEHDGVMPGNFSDVLMGHFHRVDVMDIGTGSAYICGTMKGGDEFALQRVQAITPPKQVVTYWHPDYGNVGMEVIYLDRFDTLPSMFNSTMQDVWATTYAKV